MLAFPSRPCTVNGVRSVSPAIAAKVWSAVHAVGYVPNTQARALVSGRSRILGLIVSDITNSFYPELIQGFEQFAVQAGYEVLLGATNYDPAIMATTVRRMIERKVEGVAVMTSEIEPSLMEQLTGRRIPLVFVDIGPPGLRIGNIQVNYAAGVRQAVQHLYRLGHRSLAFIGGPNDLKSAQLRRDAFVRCTSGAEWKAAGPLLLAGDHKLEGGFQAVQRLLSAQVRPTAVFCSNDLTAMGVLRGLDVEGLRAPRDLSVIGFDDIHMAEYTIPPLTTVRLPRLDLARQAFQSLMAGLEETPAAGSGLTPIETSLIVRGSTARVEPAVS